MVDPIHRLDRPTSGIVIFAKNKETTVFLSDQFLKNGVEKVYLAVVRGFLSDGQEIDFPLSKDLQGTEKPALTFVSPMERFELPYAVKPHQTARFTLCKITPKTGRRHQIRRHCAHIRRPILGDTAHGDLNQNRAFTEFSGIRRLWLHAHELKVQLPEGTPLHLVCSQPETWAFWKKWTK